MSKGSSQRPKSIPWDEFQKNWDIIYGAKKCSNKNCHEGAILEFDGDGGIYSERECPECNSN